MIATFGNRSFCALLAGVCAASHSLAAPARVLFVIGEYEYNTRETLPKFAEQELLPLGYCCHFVHAASDDRTSPTRHDFPGLMAALDEADLLVLSVRRRFLKPKELQHLQAWIRSGKPVVAIRTASHAFDAGNPEDVPRDRAAWQDFDQEVLGAKYEGHYSSKHREDQPATFLWVDERARAKRLLEGVAWEGERPITSHLYKTRSLSDSATVLLRGKAQGQESIEPVAWTYSREPGRTFYTSLGSVEDLQDPAIRRLLVNAIEWSLGDREQ